MSERREKDQRKTKREGNRALKGKKGMRLLLEQYAGGVAGDIVVDPGGGCLPGGSDGAEQLVRDPDGNGDAGAGKGGQRVGRGGGEAHAGDGVGEEEVTHDLRRRERVGCREAPVHAYRGGRQRRNGDGEEKEKRERRCPWPQRVAATGPHCLQFRVHTVAVLPPPKFNLSSGLQPQTSIWFKMLL